MFSTGRTITLGLILLFAVACATTHVPPADAAGEVASYLIAGEVNKAESRFDDIDSGDDQDVAFNVLYSQAQSLYDQRDYASAARVLRFLMERYEDKRAPKEALLLTLTLQSAREGKPPAGDELKEMNELAKELREGVENPPVWIDLVATHDAIDQGNLTAARASLARFQARFDGNPVSLTEYAEELERYLASNGGGEG